MNKIFLILYILTLSLYASAIDSEENKFHVFTNSTKYRVEVNIKWFFHRECVESSVGCSSTEYLTLIVPPSQCLKVHDEYYYPENDNDLYEERRYKKWIALNVGNISVDDTDKDAYEEFIFFPPHAVYGYEVRGEKNDVLGFFDSFYLKPQNQSTTQSRSCLVFDPDEHWNNEASS